MPLKMNSNHLSVCSHLFVVTFSIVLIMLFSPWHIIFISPFKAPFLLDFTVVLFFPVSPHPTPTPTLLPTSVNNSSVCHVYTLPIHLPQIDHQGGKWYGCDHGHERAVKWEFLGKGKTYWRSFGFLDCAYKRIILPHFLQVLGLVLYPTPQKSHLSIAFLYRILRSCQGLASVCKSILPFLIFVAWFLFWGFFFSPHLLALPVAS